jgi:predicted RNA-binding Zn-ribbon protein involved in translation (DUF1610 family)
VSSLKRFGVAADGSAMATIRASCPECGDVELTTADMTVRVCADDQRGSYAFRCPSCAMAVTKSAEPRIVDLLVSSGVPMQTWTLPLELSEPRPIGDPFCHDDLLAFHELLEQEGWLERLCQDRS